MAMAAHTARFAEIVRQAFAGREFTPEEFADLARAEDGCTLETLRRHRVVAVASPRYRETRRFSPAEFAAFVTDDLCGGDLWDYCPEFVWDADSGEFVEREELHPHYVVCEAA